MQFCLKANFVAATIKIKPINFHLSQNSWVFLANFQRMNFSALSRLYTYGRFIYIYVNIDELGIGAYALIFFVPYWFGSTCDKHQQNIPLALYSIISNSKPWRPWVHKQSRILVMSLHIAAYVTSVLEWASIVARLWSDELKTLQWT